MAVELKRLLLDNTPLAQDFFEALSTRDRSEKVFAIISKIHKKDPAAFREYARLAMAIALVYDQRPASGWPHYQVSASALPCRLPKPEEAFDFWVASDRSGKTLHKFAKLSIEELKFVVDTPAPFEELKWAQKLRPKLSTIPKLYGGFQYDDARYEQGRYVWEGSSYVLEEIKERGGICVDQAYFTATVAKANGVPAMLVSGSGKDGRHAWVGFMEKPGKWNFETGRYPESKFVTGHTYDPQTWERSTDH